MEHTIDATEKKLGRVASEAAILLMGKNSPAFEKNKVADVKVKITNVSKLNVENKKLDNKEYQTYSGYPGGRKVKKMKQVIEKKGYAEVLKLAIYGMLPANKLRSKVLKNLMITE
ncbi:50S ribosomal protein L13 [Candidatus Campbellbacteria bacterium RIFOXYC2_FULL_35_25]|uniref:50S ribosomal protein L13 n=1 Tax=Candidatus Campbellbacteria bacterium RIFOXYC2_FULL_35_25 TaxID=1797582 RepID=A0A1F5EK21_9BACT|nr:MAG: 50S ribosomal protein L13 [Candidatus Campbellbacteria bacterium RIFOXYC2_FULL_35_25]